MCPNTNDFFAGAWFKYDSTPFETKGFDAVLCTVTAQFEDYSILEINMWQAEPILIFDSILPAFGLENKGGNVWKFKHYYFVKNKKEGYDTFVGNIKYLHEFQRIMISIKESGVIYKSDILNHIRP